MTKGCLKGCNYSVTSGQISKMTSSSQFSSVTQLCPTPCDPMDCSTPGLPVHHQFPKFTQTCPLSWWCHPAISSSVILFSFHLQSFPASGSFQMSQFFASGGWSIGSFTFSISPSNEYSGMISFTIHWLGLLAVQGTQESSPTPLFKSINSSALSYLYSPTLRCIHAYWKTHSFD